MKKIIVHGLIMLVLITASEAIGAEKLHIEGSTTVGPIADGFAEVFKNLYPDVTITVNKSGSGTGAAALIDSRCDIATMSRFMKDKEFKDSVGKGVMLLIVYSAGLGIPFLLTTVAMRGFFKLFSKINRYMGLIQKTSGAILVLLGILMITGKLTLITAKLSFLNSLVW